MTAKATEKSQQEKYLKTKPINIKIQYNPFSLFLFQM